MPQAERPTPPYLQIVRYYREIIQTGKLAAGARLPSIVDIAAEWNVAAATAAKAISALQVEGVVWSSPVGTFVAGDDVYINTPSDRIKANRVQRAPATAEDVVDVNAAEIITAPDYVASILGLEPGSTVIRREEITSRKGHRKMLSVDWIPATSKEVAEAMTSPERLPDPPEMVIRSLTGRRVTEARDSLRGRAADGREAAALRVPVGSPILAGVHEWHDEEGVILYGEWVVPANQVVSYRYAVVQTA